MEPPITLATIRKDRYVHAEGAECAEVWGAASLIAGIKLLIGVDSEQDYKDKVAEVKRMRLTLDDRFGASIGTNQEVRMAHDRRSTIGADALYDLIKDVRICMMATVITGEPPNELTENKKAKLR